MYFMVLVAIKNGFLFLNLALTGIASVKRHNWCEIRFLGLDSCLNSLAEMLGSLLVGHFGFFFFQAHILRVMMSLFFICSP